MKAPLIITMAIAITAMVIIFGKQQHSCKTGAFLSDQPSVQDIDRFKEEFGKKPHVVVIFVSWKNLIDSKVIEAVYTQGSVLMVTLEPWEPQSKAGIDFKAMIEGGDDAYLEQLAQQLKAINKPVYLRFGHEMNGNWYPWAGHKIGTKQYIASYRHVKDVFDRIATPNVKWVFAINWQNVPEDNNDWNSYYPGDAYVDYMGIDGYNWGNTQGWSRWMSFKDIFVAPLNQIKEQYRKPVIISEFGSANQGGDRKIWIKEAMNFIRKRPEIEAFVLFNINKEVHWRLHAEQGDGQELKQQLKSAYFHE